MEPRLYSFVGGDAGVWRVVGVNTMVGEPMLDVPRLDILRGPVSELNSAKWVLRGITSNERYVVRDEKRQLAAKQPAVGRLEAVCAALIPIRKTAAWWSLSQDERREVFDEQSNHVKTGLRYLPAVARRLHHCRDLGENEPFDFLTWFEFAKADSAAFDRLLIELRATPEWAFVEREVEIRLIRDAA